ncbi:hypothetical protein SNOG_07309 [Parastagonospora nodorum SN15]|uniref:Uncharacterized protein n=1 Tax=Phaeosphaeria nodorum (strain SN15 / ATCC MYA-4574 / FGSC 10173) TaxID=321614 RepID=Q0ULQ5_PHANO|nr:hypothetical protein SNOG_07309 [Parastagonospora nodorum SN15]EAT84775.1 hypothetical protein SNOG_07309 [Parastagonospora nodorum SN15]
MAVSSGHLSRLAAQPAARARELPTRPPASVEALQDRVAGFALCFFPAIHGPLCIEFALVSSKAHAPPSFIPPLPSASIHLENTQYYG